MKFYTTTEPCRKLRHVISNLSSYYVIDVDEMLENSTLDMTKSTHRYLMNSEIERLITSGAHSKRYSGIMYINSALDCDTIVSIKNALANITNSFVDGMAIIDNFDSPKLKEYYKLFDEVVFFQPLKRGRIIECTSVEERKKERKNVFDKDI